MPSTIPYDPSLILGNLVSKEKLANLTQISTLQAPVDAAEDEMNSFIALKRSIDMTIQEMVNMGIDTTDLAKENQQVGQNLQKAAIAFAKAKLEAEQKIQPLMAKISTVNDSIESPIDYNRSQIKKIPLAADSLKMNCQYFAFDENSQSSSTHAATISSFVSGEVSEFGEDFAASARSSAQSQVNSQHSNHTITGTLVISISCTHKDAAVFAPYILDVDKAVRVWNAEFPKSPINPTDPASVAQTEATQNGKDEESLFLLSGATFGSCFIGMVHTLDTTDTRSSQAMYSVAESLQTQFKVGGWFAEASGQFGVDSSFSNDAKNLLSTQNISSHCTLIAMGSIPSMKSNQVTMAVKGFTQDDPAKTMEALGKLQNNTVDAMPTIDSSAQNAQTGQKMISMQTAKVEGVLSGLSDIDNQNNKMIDTNSMMDAMEDYLNKCLAGNIGVPINYYLKPITKSEITRAWLAKYYPNQYNKAGSADDSSASGSSAPLNGDSSSDNSGTDNANS